ncbi:MAG: hypothetical protein ACOVMG_03620 [Flavobacterium sp.]
MIQEKDLPLLILVEEKLIELNSDSIPVTMGDFKDIFIDRSHFNNIARILVKHKLAKEPKSIMPNIVAIIKTDLTGYKRIKDIFNEEQEDKKREETKYKAITTDLKSKGLFSAPNLANYIAAGCAALGLIYGLYNDSKLKSVENEKKSLQEEVFSLQKANAQYLDILKDSLHPYENKTNTKIKGDSTTNK